MYLVFLLYFSFSVFFVLFFVLSPVLIQSDVRVLLGAGALAYNLASIDGVCHQLPQRSVALGGVFLPVCARCFGIYVGVALGMLASFFPRLLPGFFRSKTALIVFVSPMILDGVAQTILELGESSNTSRIATGFFFGFGLLYFASTRVWAKSGVIGESKKKDLVFIVVFTNIILFLIVILSGFVLGGWYVSKGDATKIVLDDLGYGSPADIRVFYISPKVETSIHWDPYLSSYDDPILEDVYGIGGSHVHGIWAVVLPGEREGKQGRHVFTPRVSGVYYYVDALSGGIIEKRFR